MKEHFSTRLLPLGPQLLSPPLLPRGRGPVGDLPAPFPTPVPPPPPASCILEGLHPPASEGSDPPCSQALELLHPEPAPVTRGAWPLGLSWQEEVS